MKSATYNVTVCESQQQLFHPELADQLAEARKQTDPLLIAHLQSIGFPTDYIPLIKDWQSFVDATIRYGTLPIRSPMEGCVVNDPPTPDLLESMHPQVQDKFQEQFPHFQTPFYIFTRGEDWWHGKKMFMVNDADSYLVHLQYEMSIRLPEVRNHKGKRKGRPVDLTTRSQKAEQAARYKQWVEQCRAYKKQLLDMGEDVRVLEEDVKQQIEAIEFDAQHRKEHLLSILARRKMELNALRYKGAPKFVP